MSNSRVRAWSKRALKAEARVEQLKLLREIAIDVEACLEPGGEVPEFMRLAFIDAITRTAELGEATRS